MRSTGGFLFRIRQRTDQSAEEPFQLQLHIVAVVVDCNRAAASDCRMPVADASHIELKRSEIG